MMCSDYKFINSVNNKYTLYNKHTMYITLGKKYLFVMNIVESLFLITSKIKHFIAVIKLYTL